MTFIILFILIIIAIVFQLFKWQRLSRSLYAAICVLFIAIGCGLVPKFLLTNLQSPYAATAPISWDKQNVIVLLGAGTEKIPDTNDVEVGSFAYGRVAKTAALYDACKKTGEQCKIIVSGGDAQHHGAAEAAIYGRYLQELGVKETDLILDTNSRNTWQNAQYTAALLKQQKIDSAHQVLLVTSGIHMRRSLLYFSHFGIDAHPVRTDYLPAKTAWFPIAYNFLATDFSLNEYIGAWRYQAYNQLGWNSAAVKAGPELGTS